MLAVAGLVLALAPAPVAVGATRARISSGWVFTAYVHQHPRRLAHRPQARLDYARTAIVGGSQIAIERAPWQVALLGEIPVELEGERGVLRELCGGAILGETRVLTAAHCMFDPETGEQAPAEDFLVVAGSSDLDQRESTEQSVAVAGVRVHPYFSYAVGPGGPDDVAVLRLNRSLNLAGTAARAISVASADSRPTESSQVQLSGFGQQSTYFDPSGKLYSLGMRLGASSACGGEADALFLCASAPTGSACGGDSGSGLTTAGGTPALIGILSTIEVISGEQCDHDAYNGFTDLTAPEISDFVASEGSSPPKAPRGGAGFELTSPWREPETGESLTCSPGSWSGSPTFTYSFIESADRQVLQSGASSVYQLTAADIGRTILCELQAANAGGTAVERTAALAAVTAGDTETGEVVRKLTEAEAAERKAREAAEKPPAAPPPPTGEWCGEGYVPCAGEPTPGSVWLIDSALTVQDNGIVLVKLDCKEDTPCSGKLTLLAKTTGEAKGKQKAPRTITIGSRTFSITADKTVIVEFKLNVVGRALLGAADGRLGAALRVLKSLPAPSHTHTQDVRLVQKKAQRRALGKTQR